MIYYYDIDKINDSFASTAENFDKFFISNQNFITLMDVDKIYLNLETVRDEIYSLIITDKKYAEKFLKWVAYFLKTIEKFNNMFLEYCSVSSYTPHVLNSSVDFNLI